MKLILLIATVALSLLACTSQKSSSGNCYKGRLEVKGICSNYTIKVLEGNVDTSKVASAWKDETTGKEYTNVFGLGSPCTFPDSLKEGDEFYFVVSDTAQQCAVCMAYYPTPSKKISIKVLDKPCN